MQNLYSVCRMDGYCTVDVLIRGRYGMAVAYARMIEDAADVTEAVKPSYNFKAS
ncbi:hypothetical protein [uncultured Selenomonas sp.]|uniref:hypothetical protein n=1 Tax=uncultured Selenomonas sp. TaxID=159275 RepID=UPI0028D2FCF3|nr:hypothetical protein [uncultured Selenomonas sp.]